MKNDVSTKTLNLLNNDIDTVLNILSDFADMADKEKNKIHGFLTAENHKDVIINILVTLRSKYKL